MKQFRQGRNFHLYQAYEVLMQEKIVQNLTMPQLRRQFSRFKLLSKAPDDSDRAFEFCKHKMQSPGKNAIKRIKQVVFYSYGREDVD